MTGPSMPSPDAWRGLRALLVALLLAGPAAALEAGGVTFPDTRTAGGAALKLNGAGVRLYSVFRVNVYAAGLYLEQPSTSADAILRSPGRKLIEVRALRAVAADDIQSAWRKSFEANCQAPCRIPADAERFVAAVQPSRVGDANTYVFGPGGLQTMLNGQETGRYGPEFGQLLLYTFIGPSPPTEALKRALLGG